MSRRPTKAKPRNYKYLLKSKNAPRPSGKTPGYVSKLRQEYLKKGKLSPQHKKFLNTVAKQRVVKKKGKGCTTCGLKIKRRLGR